jgi:uncharacterized repeat protein (TIGR03809 family)
MSDEIPRTMSAATMSKWYLLAEERSRHLTELQRTGRWRRYYTQEQLLVQIEEATQAVRMWQQMMECARSTAADAPPTVPLAPAEPAASEQSAEAQPLPAVDVT